MARKIVPFSLDLPRITKKEAGRRLGICRLRLDRMIEEGDLILVATAPGVRARILETSVDAALDRINSMATAG